MTKLHMLIGFILLALCFIASEASALPVNETVNGFMIAFDIKDDTNMIIKVWGNGDTFSNSSENMPDLNASSLACVAAGNGEKIDSSSAMCFVIVLNTAENTSSIEEKIIDDINKKYLRVYDRVFDGHKGLLIKEGNSSSDPDMESVGLYWLDEDQGKASKLVTVATSLPWDDGAEQLMNTVHVEEIQNN